MTAFLFYLFATVLLVSGALVITARSTVHAALFLVLAFFNAACLWMMLKAEFLAITLVLVYVGAVMVLFLFVVMMLSFKPSTEPNRLVRHLPMAVVLGVVIAVEMSLVLMNNYRFSTQAGVNADMASIPNTQLLGMHIYTHYLYPLELAAVLLLVAMIAAIALTLRGRKDAKGQDPSQQVRVRKADRLKMVQIQPPQVVEAEGVAADTQGKAS
ncbi:NADH-quinone oxidoreductase subunit J [Amphibiibacter pelophylacis]|uniref:NADH-quinone oxidoreductase subunit J n=1 Tax=Amphibiibacter pelophylacis TaxID=1799477 RepID=A0ACC6P0K1_9BURK